MSDTPGFCNNNSGGRRFLVRRLYANDEVTFDVVNLSGVSQTISLDDNCSIATSNGNTFTMKEKGSLVVKITNLYSIKSITIKHDNSAFYNVKPAIEIYNPRDGNLSLYDKAFPDFQLNGQNTSYLYNTNGISWNNRLAIPNNEDVTKWSMDGSGLKLGGNWQSPYFLSIADLKEGDRVRITYDWGQGNQGWHGIHFRSNGSSLNSEAFKDVNNNGDFDEDYGENKIVFDELVDQNVFYTMSHDGHLDLYVYPQVRITKIEIYADHRADIVSEEQEDGSYTMYFDGTGQIKEKSYMVPGGLKVQFGNDNENELAYVVANIEGPVSYINDYQGFKMARNSNNNIHQAEPTTGTYYRFVPDVDGKIKFSFKAQSLRYTPYSPNSHGVYWHPGDYNVPDQEEIGLSENCDYHLYYRNDNNEYAQLWNTTKGNGALVSTFNKNDLEVKAGKVYYLYGTWNGDFGQGAYCGVAELLSVNFLPDKFVSPLAKCIDNASQGEAGLANVQGYTDSDISIKRKSGNILSCEPYIDQATHKLGVRNITYADGADKAGVVLIKLGNGAKDPVFVLTIAYDASYCSQEWDETTVGYTEGHKWDFSTDPLELGTYYQDFFGGNLNKNTSSQIYDETDNRFDGEGKPYPEWTFAYLTKVSSGQLDPFFFNFYDMDGDNADMIWETGGLWFEAGSNESGIFNEKIGSIDRSDKTQADPQRFVGIVPGAKFTIPKLKQDDRVVIYMGNSASSSSGPVCLNITNALDALGTEITSEYRIGGSVWNTYDSHNDPNYRGAYHFFAKEDGDMTFEMVGGKICKIYEIRIYHGNHLRTNDIERVNNGPLVLVNEEGATTAKSAGFNIHFRGKGERITNPEVLVKTGNLSNDSFTSDYLKLNNNSTGVTFTTRVGDFGNFRLRLKDMDYRGNYLCDFSDRNLTVGFKQKLSYKPQMFMNLWAGIFLCGKRTVRGTTQ